jgi:hypothetical protein
MKEEGGFCDRNSSNFLNPIKGIKASALNLVAVFHRKRGVFHRNRQVFHNSFDNYRAKNYWYKFRVFWISTAIFCRKSQGSRISTSEPKARNHRARVVVCHSVSDFVVSIVGWARLEDL